MEVNRIYLHVGYYDISLIL